MYGFFSLPPIRNQNWVLQGAARRVAGNAGRTEERCMEEAW